MGETVTVLSNKEDDAVGKYFSYPDYALGCPSRLGADSLQRTGRGEDGRQTGLRL
jgi:hypothetical protein